MSRTCLFAAFVCLAGACDDASVELPHDAARPVAPPAAMVMDDPPAPRAPAPETPPAERADLDAELPDEVGPERPADVSRAPKGYVRRSINPQLRGRALAHRVYRANFGPSEQSDEPTAVVLTRSKGAQARVSGFAHSKDTRYDFPPLHDGGALDRVAAVMFRDVDDDPDREVIVLIAYQDEDPEAPPYFSNVVLDWDAPQGRFVRLEQLEGEIEAFSTAGDVLVHLRRVSPP